MTHIKGGEAVSLAVQSNHTYVYANIPRRTAVAKINSVAAGSVVICRDVVGGDGSYELFRLPQDYSENYALTLVESKDILLVGTRSPAAILIMNGLM